MFRNSNTVTAEPAHDDVDVTADDLIPVSHLALDLPEPPAGAWTVYLAAKGIEVVLDDIGRLAISRDNARQLITEHRENEARQRELAERREAQLIEQDRQRRQPCLRVFRPAWFLTA